MRRACIALLGTVFLSCSDSHAGTFTVLNAETLARGTEQPVVVQRAFSVSNPSADYFLRIENGGESALSVTSAEIRVNGVTVVSANDLDSMVTYFEKQILLLRENVIDVELRGKPGSTMTLQVVGIDEDPPTITASLNPNPNSEGWNNSDVTVSFDCADVISGIASCSPPITLTAETAATEITGTAYDNAGNTADFAVTLRVDKTPPQIDREWPPIDFFQTDLDSVPVSGFVIDQLSGAASGQLEDSQGILALDVPEFEAGGRLDTSIPAGQPWSTTSLLIRATDSAGNTSELPFSVRHVEGLHVLPASPDDAVIVNGQLVSVNRALIAFDNSVSRTGIEGLLAQAGGRSNGYLPGKNAVTAEFATTTSEGLQAIVEQFRARADVKYAFAVKFSLLGDDNQSLPADKRVAYDSVRALEASGIVNRHFWLNLPLSPVTIAVIDSGLDPSFGIDEYPPGFTTFIDFCDPTNVTTLDRNGHGTGVTGVIAAAENGEGNNGVLSGIDAGQFNYIHMAVACDQTKFVDPSLIGAALDRLTSGEFGQIHVVNLSIAGEICHFSGLDAPLCNAEDNALAAMYSDDLTNPIGSQMILVAGAGNGLDPDARDDGRRISCSRDAYQTIPAILSCDLPNVVTVGGFNPALQSNGTIRIAWDQSVNEGDAVTIKAPSDHVYTTTVPNDYSELAGTSVAAPFVTGTAAMMLAIDPSLEPGTIKRWLRETAQPARFSLGLPTRREGLHAVGAVIATRGWTLGGGWYPWLQLFTERDQLVDAHAVARPAVTGFEFIAQSPITERIDSIGVRNIRNIAEPDVAERIASTFGLETEHDYFWAVNRRSLPVGTTFHSVTIGGPNVGQARSSIGSPGTMIPVLAGFQIAGSMHSLEDFGISIWPDDGAGQGYVEVIWSDGSPADDFFSATVEYALVPADRIDPFNQVVHPGFFGGFREEITAIRPVLQSFRMTFLNGSHLIREIGVSVEPGELNWRFEDADRGDPVDFVAVWAELL